MAEDKKEALLEFPKSMTHLEASVRLSIDNLEKEVVTLKKNLENAQKQLDKAAEDVQEQMGEFLGVRLILFIHLMFNY